MDATIRETLSQALDRLILSAEYFDEMDDALRTQITAAREWVIAHDGQQWEPCEEGIVFEKVKVDKNGNVAITFSPEFAICRRVAAPATIDPDEAIELAFYQAAQESGKVTPVAAPAPLTAPDHDGWWWFRGTRGPHGVLASYNLPVRVSNNGGVLIGVTVYLVSELDGHWWPITPPAQEATP